MIRIKSDNIFLENGIFAKGSIDIVDDRIKTVSNSDKLNNASSSNNINEEENDVIDATGMYVIPGLVDIHFHGCVGQDFCNGTSKALDAIAKYELSQGVTSISPATMTLSREELNKIYTVAGEYIKDIEKEGKVYDRSTIRGITMEGPFVSMAKKGAQTGAYIHKPDVDFFREMQEACGGMIKQVAVAPEEDDELEFSKEISKECVISVAHSAAGYDIADKAFKEGATHATHLFNAMPPFHHRDPGVIGAVADNEQVYAEMICDGVHIHPAMVRAMFKILGPERICMISDSMEATGLSDGDYTLGGQAVKVIGNKATLADGTIAGSASNLLDCFRVAVNEMNIPLESVVMACTLTPAKSLRIDDEIGSLEEGKLADIVILDKKLNIVKIIKSGKVVL